MTSFDPSSDELVSAYLDGEATEAERALVESDPALRARVETFRGVSSAVATPPPMPDAAAREAAIAAALGASNTTEKVTSLAPVQERRSRFSGAKTGILSAAALILVLFLGGIAVVTNLSGDDSADVATDAADTAESFETTADDAAGDIAGDLSGDAVEEEEAMEDDEEEEAMEDEEEAMEDEEEEEAMEDEDAATLSDDDSADEAESADAESAFAIRSFESLAALTDVFAAEETSEQPATAAREFSPEVLEMSDACRAEDSQSNTNSLVFIEPATVFIDGESIDVLVYRDELVDADPFIRVFALANCEPIQ